MTAFLVIILWLVEKTAEIALSKLLEKLLSEENLEYLVILFKLHVLAFYLNWILWQTPVKSLPGEQKIELNDYLRLDNECNQRKLKTGTTDELA